MFVVGMFKIKKDTEKERMKHSLNWVVTAIRVQVIFLLRCFRYSSITDNYSLIANIGLAEEICLLLS